MSKVAGPHPKSVFCMQEATLFIFFKILFNYLHVTVPWLNHIAVQTSDFPVQWKLVKVSVRWTAGCWLTRVVPTPQRLLAYLLVNTYIIKCQINFKESIYILESGEQDWRAAEKTRTHWGNIITSHHHTRRSGKVLSIPFAFHSMCRYVPFLFSLYEIIHIQQRFILHRIMYRIQLSSASAKILIMPFGNSDGEPDVNSARVPRQGLRHLSSNLIAKAKRDSGFIVLWQSLTSNHRQVSL